MTARLAAEVDGEAPAPAAQDLGSLFLQSAGVFPQREACRVGELAWTYAELREEAMRLGAVLVEAGGSTSGEPLPVLLGVSRSLSGYASVLASLLGGLGYVPLSPAWPLARTREVMALTGSRTLVVDSVFLDVWPSLLEGEDDEWTVVIPQSDRPEGWVETGAGPRVLWWEDVRATSPLAGPRARATDRAFTLFTSGSTGRPKGVCLSHGAALATRAAMADRYTIECTDRFAQTADFTWDPSVVDMFLAWGAGASVTCASARQVLLPDAFVRGIEATVVHLVPATVRQLERAGRLKPGRLASLRLVLVGGEPFPASLARALALAAPQALIVNIYGAQEYSIISTFEADVEALAEWPQDKPLPLGRPFPGSQLRLLTENGESEGELVVAGPQLFSGYLGEEAMTRQAHVTLPEAPGRVFYRTGDIARLDECGRLMCGGRRDSQVKIAGVRVEIGEIEAALRRASGSDSVLVLPWRPPGSDVPRLVGFVSGSVLPEERILESLRLALPGYSVPARLVLIESWPRTANGKWDRQALLGLLEPSTAVVPGSISAP